MDTTEFKYFLERVEDIKILRFRADGFENLSLQQKKLLYFLSQAGYCGRDIIYDQKYKHNLLIRRVFEAIYKSYTGNRESKQFQEFHSFLKRIWISNGIHHHYSSMKFMPRFSGEYFKELINVCFAELSFSGYATPDELYDFLSNIIFNKNFESKLVNQQQGIDIVANSANNFYEGLNQKEVEDYFDKISDKNDPTPISYGLNSKMVKENGQIVEKIWKVGGMYTQAIEKICYWLDKAKDVASNSQQKKVIELLIEYYTTGKLKTFDEHSIEWLKETESEIDFFNGFIEVYGDPMGYKATFESIVWFEDKEMTRKLGKISDHAGWFEKNSPIHDAYKRANPSGMSYKLINVVSEGGDCLPTSPIGVNLPNADWMRGNFGSKSISLSNVEDTVDEATKNEGVLDEFYLPAQRVGQRKYSNITGKIHTGLHEVIGHGSGKLKPGVATPKETLKNYSNTIEEARADLVALYYFIDPYLVDIDVLPNIDAGKAEYDSYFVKGLFTQLYRIPIGEDIEESHMRNRHLIAKWCYEKGKADNIIELLKHDGKSFLQINDYEKLRVIVGQLLKEVQRIKSEGDYEAALNLVEGYGVHPDADIHKEIVERYKKLNVASLMVMIPPVIEAESNDGEITDVKLSYYEDFTEFMLYHSEKYSYLPLYN